MVKFSKELEAQLIPEWKEAFVNYWQLKKHIKKIKLARKPKQVAATTIATNNNNADFGFSIFDPIRSFFSSARSTSSSSFAEIIKVRRKTMAGCDQEVYQTELLQLFSEEDEMRAFFEKLDEELNKVNQFYKAKEKEFMQRGDILNKQLDVLMDLKRILADVHHRRLTKSSSNTSSTAAAGMFSRSWSSNSSSTRTSDFSGKHLPSSRRPFPAGTKQDQIFGKELGLQSDFTGGETPTSEQSETEEVIAALEKNGVNFVNSNTRTKTSKKGSNNYNKPKMALRVDIPATTPTRTIAAVTSMLWEDLVNNPKKGESGGGDHINRKKIQCAEKMIRSAFVELYRGLGLLKTYSSLNMVAFTKILKKFDKVANQQASPSYLREVKKSHFISSDKAVRLMDEVECIFTKHFANNDRKKTMKFLRPQQQKESHMVTFFVGLFTGCFVSLFSVYAILAHLSGIFSPTTGRSYVETVYPVFSVFALLSLHLFMYGCNLFMWKATRINYNFIFEFQHSTSLKYRDAFLICTTFMTSVVGAMVIHLLLRAAGFSASQVDAIPGVLILIFIALLICPFDILYRPTRYYFLRIMRNIVCSPLYKVLLVDIFMADQLTSQIPLLRYMESTACYFVAGSFKTHRFETCTSGRLYRDLVYLISFLPYYWRAMQCLRRWIEESDANQLANMGKYVSAMVAAGARLTYAKKEDHLWFAIVLVTSALATVYQLYWDFVKDWGLLNPKSKNPWLRDDLILKNKSLYYISIALNVVLRVAWVETVMGFRFKMVESRLLDFFLASLEVIRRGHWNFYRLENEHVSNVGKCKAVKPVSVPFRDVDSD